MSRHVYVSSKSVPVSDLSKWVVEHLEQIRIVFAISMKLEYIGHCESLREPESMRHSRCVTKLFDRTLHVEVSRLICLAYPRARPFDTNCNSVCM